MTITQELSLGLLVHVKVTLKAKDFGLILEGTFNNVKIRTTKNTQFFNPIPHIFRYRAKPVAKPQPDNRDGNEICIGVLNNFYADGIKWHDVACHHKKPTICEL